MSDHVNLSPGTKVPKSGNYKCEFCGEGGLADMMGKYMGKAGLDSMNLRGLAVQKSVRFFEHGKKFTECSNCGPATGWTLVEERSSASEKKHDEAVVESGVCDVCGNRVNRPEGHLLTTKEVVGTPAYWQRYYEIHRSEMTGAVSSYSEFCGNTVLRNGVTAAIAGQRTPWLVCEKCVALFGVDVSQVRSYARQWWESRKTFEPPGTGAAPLSAVRMEATERVSAISQAPAARSTEMFAAAPAKKTSYGLIIAIVVALLILISVVTVFTTRRKQPMMMPATSTGQL